MVMEQLVFVLQCMVYMVYSVPSCAFFPSNSYCWLLDCDLQVVFFGDNVPRQRVELSTTLARSADALLVVGSTVMTMSALRLVR